MTPARLDDETLDLADPLPASADGGVSVGSWAAKSDLGLRRTENQDRWSASGAVFVVADGMGGLGGGALAASTTCSTIEALIGPHPVERPWQDLLVEVDEVVRAVGSEAGLATLGSTVAILDFADSCCTYATAGDSRVYRLRGGVLTRLSSDHSLRQHLVANGVNPADGHSPTSGLTSFIGCGPERLTVGLGRVGLRAGDRFALTSDGIHGQIADSLLCELIEIGSCQDAVDALIDASISAGGRDNATAIIVEVDVDAR